MKGISRLLVLTAIVSLAASALDAHAKGGGSNSSAGKVSGWIAGSAPAGALPGLPPTGSPASSNGKGKAGTVQGYSAMPTSTAPGMGGLQMTPNGMIMQNTPAMTVSAANGLAGSSAVGDNMRGIGNSRIDTASKGVGNSQGGGGTMDIAAMTHFGGSGLAAVSTLVSSASGVNVSSVVSHFMGPSSASSGTGTGTTSHGKAAAAAKAQFIGVPSGKSCAGSKGAKSGCS